jgi:hypothetical protein
MSTPSTVAHALPALEYLSLFSQNRLTFASVNPLGVGQVNGDEMFTSAGLNGGISSWSSILSSSGNNARFLRFPFSQAKMEIKNSNSLKS